MEDAKEATNGEIAVVWRPSLCWRSGACMRGLPAVFNLDQRDWINLEAASPAEIIAQIGQCPSGALSYYLIGERTEGFAQPAP